MSDLTRHYTPLAAARETRHTEALLEAGVAMHPDHWWACEHPERLVNADCCFDCLCFGCMVAAKAYLIVNGITGNALNRREAPHTTKETNHAQSLEQA